MPVTARLSRMFYERLGDEIANELVNWFNAVDTAYRTDLNRVNEANLQHLDATVTRRFAQADAILEHRLTDVRADVERRHAAIEATIERQCSALRNETVRTRNGLLTWMFAFWATMILVIVTLAVA